MRAPQLDLDLAPKTWGGARPGAGRKKSGTRRDPLHRIRPEHVRRHPVHVVLRVRKAVGRLRRREVFTAAWRALDAMLAKHAAFRVVHLSMQHNHLHLLVEAQDKRALSRGMQAFATSLARRINSAAGRRGKVFEYRYHATAITSPRQARHALAYVLNNWRRHQEDLRQRRAKRALVDPYSSALAFDGWRGIASFSVPAGYTPLPTAKPQTWLLREGWRRAKAGAIDPWEVPGHLR